MTINNKWYAIPTMSANANNNNNDDNKVVSKASKTASHWF